MEEESALGRLRVMIRERPAAARWLRRIVRPAWMGTLRRTQPLSARYGQDRGQPVDRYYIESFLAEHRCDIRGRVLEIKGSHYATRFGSALSSCEVLDIDPSNKQATIVADLQRAESVPSDAFDCFVLTHTLGMIADPRAAIVEAHRILRPGGVLLVTVPGFGSRAATRAEAPADYWRFTEDALRLLVKDAFVANSARFRCYGNVLSAVASLMGMAAEELSRRELDTCDERFPVVIAARAVKE